MHTQKIKILSDQIIRSEEGIMKILHLQAVAHKYQMFEQNISISRMFFLLELNT